MYPKFSWVRFGYYSPFTMKFYFSWLSRNPDFSKPEYIPYRVIEVRCLCMGSAIEGVWVMFNPWSLNYLVSVVKHNSGHLNFAVGLIVFYVFACIINHEVKVFKYYLYALFLRQYPILEMSSSTQWYTNIDAPGTEINHMGRKFLDDIDNKFVSLKE